MNKTIEVNIPSCQELYNSLPADCKDRYVKLFSDDELTISMYRALQYHYNRIISMMINDCSNAVRPVVYMGLFDKRGDQCICNWSASDNTFHGHNTRRWIIGGYLLYDIRDNTFSIHT
jgi:hypothetical protein